VSAAGPVAASGSSIPSAGSGRNQQLDALRGIAVLLVLFHHLPARETSWFEGGWTGVDLFFVLSGFLVSGLLFRDYLKTGSVHALRFYARRGFKIYPNFYVMLVVTTAVVALAGVPTETGRLWHEALFVQNYLPVAWWAREHGWSLAVEEHFYFLLPPFVAALSAWAVFRRRPVRTATVLVATLGAAVLAARAWMVAHGATLEAVLFRTHARIDALAFGVWLSVVWNFAPASVSIVRRWRAMLFPVGLLLTLPSYVVSIADPRLLTLGLTANYLGYGMVLAAALATERPIAGPMTRPLAFVGFYSYSIYLWHFPVLALVLQTVPARPYDRIVFLAASVAVGVAVARAVELPALRLRERLVPALPAAAPPG
jgi:peptidoglycan/LPS O-acetylase OafA/YrhL